MPPTAYRVGDAEADAGSPPAAPPSAPPGTPAPRPAPTAAAPAPTATEPSPRGHRGWDIVLSVVLLVVGAAAAGLASVLALFLAFASDSCGSGTCDYDQMNVGFWVALVAPWGVWLLGVVATIMLLVRRRLGFWVPLVGIALGAVAWVVGAWLVGSAIG